MQEKYPLVWRDFNDPPKLLAFGTWKCGCTILTETWEQIAKTCPEHGDYLLGKDWTDNPNNAPLGFDSGAIYKPYPTKDD